MSSTSRDNEQEEPSGAGSSGLASVSCHDSGDLDLQQVRGPAAGLLPGQASSESLLELDLDSLVDPAPFVPRESTYIPDVGTSSADRQHMDAKLGGGFIAEPPAFGIASSSSEKGFDVEAGAWPSSDDPFGIFLR